MMPPTPESAHLNMECRPWGGVMVYSWELPRPDPGRRAVAKKIRQFAQKKEKRQTSTCTGTSDEKVVNGGCSLRWVFKPHQLV